MSDKRLEEIRERQRSFHGQEDHALHLIERDVPWLLEQIDALRAERDVLAEVLAPFARLAEEEDRMPWEYPSYVPIIVSPVVRQRPGTGATLGDACRARKVLTKHKESTS